MGLFLRVLLLWNVLSVALLIVAITLSGTASGSTNDEAVDVGQEALAVQVGQEVALDANNSSSSQTNNSGAAVTFQVANCTINETEVCGGDVQCKTLNAYCIECDFNYSCPYGSKQKAMCSPKPNVNCMGDRQFEREYECRYCYQLSSEKTWCSPDTTCALNKPHKFHPPRPHYVSTCWAMEQYLCLGRRCFHKQRPCNWSNGYKWSTAMLLSIFLGGFGFDRFYLGLWQDGIGKLLSFGGLGVWTLVDVILIAVGYIGPWDGSLYI